MKTGLESLEVGAPDITYSGNEGPKSPQEDQQKMAEFQLQEYMEEFERVFPDMKDKRGTPDYMKELQDYFEGLASKQSEGIGDMAMKSGLIDEYRNYKMGQEDAGEPFMSPRDYYRAQEQDRMGVKEGGIMRTAFQGGGRDMGRQSSGREMGGDRNRGSTNTGNVGGASNRDGPATVSIGYGEGKVDPGLAAAAKSGPAAAGFAGTTDFGDNSLQKQYTSYIKNKPPFLGPTAAVLNKIGPALYTPSGKITAIKNRTDFVKNYFPNDLEYFNSLDDETKLSSEMMNFLNQKNLTGVREGAPGVKSIPSYGQFLFDETGNPTLLKSGNVGGGEGDGQPIILPYPTTTGMTTEDPEEVASVIPYRGDQFLRADNQALLADGGMARERAAFGGIMGDDGRRAYGLGSIFKKAARAIKKVAKSPIGKAALIGGLGYFAGGGGNPFTALGRGKFDFGNLLSLKNNRLLSSVKDGKRVFSPFKTIGLTSMLPLFMGQEEDDENLDSISGARDNTKMDIPGIRQYIAANKGRIDPSEYMALQPDFYAADGGRIGLAAGGIGNLRGALSKQMFGYDDDDEDDIKKLAFGGSAGMPPVTMMSEGQNIKSFNDDESMNMAQGTTLPNQMPMRKPMMDPRMMQMMMAQQQGGMKPMMGNRMMAAMGGRMNYNEGGSVITLMDGTKVQIPAGSYTSSGGLKDRIYSSDKGDLLREEIVRKLSFAQGGRANFAEGGESELLDMGGIEKDYRNDGGFVPMGEYERKDDVPARLSKNEFVFTADAVRNAGGGDIDKGAEIMENMMTNLENGGKVSQGSQGLDGAREMFQTQQRLGEVL